MDNKTALERMKQLLYDISSKNEILNKDNNDLNIKITSLIKLLKAKDIQLEKNKNLLKRNILKNIIFKKYIKEQIILKKAFDKFKKLNNKYDNNNARLMKYKYKLFYSHENDIYFPSFKTYKYIDTGIGDFKINFKFYIRRVACLTLLKRKKYMMMNMNESKDINYEQENKYKINLFFKNILPQNKVIDITIKSKRNNANNDNNKEIGKKRNLDFNDLHIDLINKKNEIKKFDKNILKAECIYKNYSILSDRSIELSNRISKEQYDKDISEYAETIRIIEIDNNNLKLSITQKDKEIENLEKKFKKNECLYLQEKEKLEKEIINIKKEYNILNKKINTKRFEIKIDNLNKNNFNLISKRKNKNEEFNLIVKIMKTNNINLLGSKQDVIIPFTSFNEINCFKNGFFKILGKKKKKVIFQKFNFSLNIIKDNDNSSFFINNKNSKLTISKENKIFYIGQQKSKKEKKENQNTNIEYDVIEPLKYEIDDYKHNLDYIQNAIKRFDILESSNSFAFSYYGKKNKNKSNLKTSNLYSFNIIRKPKIISKYFDFESLASNNFYFNFAGKSKLKIMKIYKSYSLDIIGKNDKKENDEIIYNLKLSANEINKKNIYYKSELLNMKLNLIFFIKRKYHFFIQFIFFSFHNKISNTFKMFHSLLIKLKMKSILKIIFDGPPKYFFMKYYFNKYKSNCLYISLLMNKRELLKNIESNNKLNSQISLFQETFKKYEESNTNEKKEKDNIIIKQKTLINNLNNELSQIKIQFEKMKKTAKDSAAELISTTNEQNKQRKLIEKLNEELKDMKNNKIVCENQIKNQQEVIKNLNEKIKKDQFEYEQNEQDVSTQIDKLKTQFNDYENSIDNLNKQIFSLKKENERLKLSNENLNNNKEELMILIQNNKNYEKENESLVKQNEELKINNETINNQYMVLKNDFDNLKILSEESKSELSKAMNEMESYSELLQTLEMKIKEAETKKNIAENERDKAINDVKEIRQRYINIMGEKYA